MLSKYKLNQLYFKDTQFANLMTRRIFNVLLIANPYDAFMLEDDGRIDEKIFNEYTSLSLRYPPRFSQVSTEEDPEVLIERGDRALHIGNFYHVEIVNSDDFDLFGRII